MASQEEFNYAGPSDSAALRVAESTGDSTGALSFEVRGYNKLDGDIQKSDTSKEKYTHANGS